MQRSSPTVREGPSAKAEFHQIRLEGPLRGAGQYTVNVGLQQ
jgi:hypothetical protein